MGDIDVPGVLDVGFVRSHVAHGRIYAIDTDDACTTRGVVAVFTGVDLDLPLLPSNLMFTPAAPGMDRSPLAIEEVRYAGEPIALVIAESAVAVADGVSGVFVDIEPLDLVLDPLDALKPNAPLAGDGESNLVFEMSSGSTEPMAEWPVEVSVELCNDRLIAAPMEPLGIIVLPGDDGQLDIWCSHQNPHGLRRQLATMFGIDQELLRVRVPDVGGAFGLKGTLYAEYLVVVAAARQMGRPLRWLQGRRENFAAGGHGRSQVTSVTLGGHADGRICAARVEIVADVGAYPHSGSFIPRSTHQMASGPYAIADFAVTTKVVVTNRAPTSPYRGAGRPEATYAIERAVDRFAVAAGLDPIEVRRINLISADAFPYETVTGARYDSGDYLQALSTALDTADIGAIRAEQVRRRETGESPLGLGVSMYVDRAGGGNPNLPGYARIEIDDEGTVLLRTGTTDSGQGHRTVWSQVAADAFGIAPADIVVIAGDTARVSEGYGTFGSRSAQTTAPPVHRCAAELCRITVALAAEMLEAAPGDIEIEHGRVQVKGDPATSMSLAKIAVYAAETNTKLVVEEVFSPGVQTFPFGAYVAAAEVDVETGSVHLLRFVAVDDCGTVLNPMITEGQVQGALAQGIGQALHELVAYDDDGQLLTSSFMDYAIPTATDMPELVLRRQVTPSPANPLGVKGIGEAGAIGAPPAIVNAVVDALAPWGVTDLQMPLRPHVVWEALRRARATQGGIT